MAVSASRGTTAHTGAAKAQRAGEKWAPWLLLAPTLVIMNVVGIYPLLHSLYISFTGAKPTDPNAHQGWVGLKNYAEVVSDGQFWHAVLVTGGFTALSVVSSLVLAVLMAILFNRPLPGFVLMRSLILIPMLITPIAVGLIWRIMMMPELGVLNYLFGFLGLGPFQWGSSRGSALAAVVLVDVWQWTPFMFIIIFAGLKSLPRSPFESAQIDGASGWQTFWQVTVPMLKPVIVIAVLLRLIDAIRTYDTIYIITRGGPDFVTDVVSIYLQRVNFRFFDLGYGSALSWVTMLLILAVVLVFVNLSGFLRIVNEKEAR
jgi:multiple sugar transport system permease protein